MPMSSKRRCGARGVVGVERTEHEVTRQGAADGEFGGLEVSNLTDQHHVRVVAKHRVEAKQLQAQQLVAVPNSAELRVTYS